MTWLFPLIGQDDRENMTRIFQATCLPMPSRGTRDLSRGRLVSDWAELARRIPELEAR